MSRIPVVFCTDGIFPHMVGGIQRHSRLLAEQLAKSGAVDLTVIHPHADTRVFDPGLQIREIALQPEPASGTYLLDCYRYSQQVLAEVLRMPQAVVYAQGLAIWSNIAKIGHRVVLNPHGLEPYQGLTIKDRLAGWPFRMILNYQFRNAAKVVSLGGHLTGLLHKHAGTGSVVVLPNAVNLPEMPARRFDGNPVKLLFVGRFSFNKGIDVLATCMQELHDAGLGSAATCFLVGKGPLFDEYVARFQLPNLRFLGFVDDDGLAALYRDCDLFVLPTLFEGMPTVVLEAMAHGMPVLVTDTGATTELVDETNGTIVEKKNVASLKEAVKHYLTLTPERRSVLSANSRKKVAEKFTWEKVAAAHIRLFGEMHAAMQTHA